MMKEKKTLKLKRKELTLRYEYEIWRTIHVIKMDHHYSSINDLVLDCIKNKYKEYFDKIESKE